MKNLTRFTMTLLFATLVLVFAAEMALAQDPVKVDPKHYKVQFENDRVRVLRITYGPHEKSVMHDHPGGRRCHTEPVSRSNQADQFSLSSGWFRVGAISHEDLLLFGPSDE